MQYFRYTLQKHCFSNQAHFKITSSAPFGGGGSQVKKRGGKGDAELGTGGEERDRRDRWGSESEGIRGREGKRGKGENLQNSKEYFRNRIAATSSIDRKKSWIVIASCYPRIFLAAFSTSHNMVHCRELLAMPFSMC